MSKPMQSDSSDSEDFEVDEADDTREDAESDHEEFQVVSFFDDKIFPTAQVMIDYCKEQYNFDFLAVLRQFDLDFYGNIKLANYIRSEAKNGNTKPDVSSIDLFHDDRYLQPVLEDDALLFCLDELVEPETQTTQSQERQQKPGEGDSTSKIQELEHRLAQIQSEHAEYRKQVEEILEKRWEENEPTSQNTVEHTKAGSDKDKDYFDSYSYSDIHETMLKDTVRTDAYRDFIYENKHLFKDKTVLDVGCGTGILSMFCARAGAAKVIAVDNSNIIDKARANILANNLGDKIVCIRGKIEEITLPVRQVDIIVSEWMGYCLLYEAMLNSVIWARDRYLSADGLMVPSHCVLHVAPVVDPEYVSESVEFWYDVYGFNMRAMMDKIYDDILVRSVTPSNLAAPSAPFFQLPLHTIKVEDLIFVKDFSVTISNNVECLDGWVIWFDTFFLPFRTAILPADPRAENWKSKSSDGIAFTTGPLAKETHWRSGVMLVDRKKRAPVSLKEGSTLSGSIEYREASSNGRGLEVEINWKEEEGKEHGKQMWYLQ